MNKVVLNTDTLPLPIRDEFSTQKVLVDNRDGGVIILPFSDISGLRGLTKGSKFTTEKLAEYNEEEKIFEARQLGE